MTYREILELYKNGKLDEARKTEVEADIEKQDAISEYLFENGTEDDWKTEGGALAEIPDAGNEQEEKQFAKEIQRSIRKAFIKMGVIVGVSVLVIVAFCSFLLPNIVSQFYYDPGKIVGGEKGELNETNQMSLDMNVYTELMLPEVRRDSVTVDSKGFGNYDIYIPQTWTYTGEFHNVAGRIERGRLILYDTNVFRKPNYNLYGWFQTQGDLSQSLEDVIKAMENDSDLSDGKGLLHGMVDSPEEGTKALKELEDQKQYTAYFTLNHMMDYEDFAKLIEDNDDLYLVWCTVKTNDTRQPDGSFEGQFEEDNLGFVMSFTASENCEWDREKYPYLRIFNMDPESGEVERTDTSDGEIMKEHFVSMLRYMQDQKKFCEMMEENPEAFQKAADFVEENGLTIYGFSATADKETLLEWDEKEEIYSIAVN